MGAQAAMVEAGNNIVMLFVIPKRFRRKDYADTTIGIYDKFIMSTSSAGILPPLSAMIAIIRSKSN